MIASPKKFAYCVKKAWISSLTFSESSKTCRSILFYNTSARHMRHETWAKQMQHKCNTSETQVAQVLNEWEMSETSATQVQHECDLKVHYCKFENVPISLSSYDNIICWRFHIKTYTTFCDMPRWDM